MNRKESKRNKEIDTHDFEYVLVDLQADTLCCVYCFAAFSIEPTLTMEMLLTQGITCFMISTQQIMMKREVRI